MSQLNILISILQNQIEKILSALANLKTNFWRNTKNVSTYSQRENSI